MQTLSISIPQQKPQTTVQETQNITLSVAREGEILNDFRRLVYEQYNKRGWLNASEYPDEIVTDKFDSASDALVIRANNEIIGGMRIVRDTEYGFPHEEELKLKKCIAEATDENDALSTLAHIPRNRIAEITRVVGKKKQRMLTFDIIKCLYWYAKTSNIDLYVFVVDMGFFTLCDTLGIPISPIGTPVFCEGSWTIPAITQPSRYPIEIPKKSPDQWSYIATPENLDDTWILH
jgi:N-acyl-L-homoserine lactone synthetase